MRQQSRVFVGCLVAAVIVVAVSAWSWRTRERSPHPAVASRDRASPNSSPLPELRGRFLDVTEEAGIAFRMAFLPQEQGEKFKINLYDHGCGVAVGDYDGDGLDDLYLLNQLGPNALYRNRGDGRFDDVTAATGLALGDRICVGATFADYDEDGDQDLYVTSTRGGNLLFRNGGDGRFEEATDAAGLRHVGHSQTAAFFDYDRDGLLDLLLVQTARWTYDEKDEVIGYFPGKGALGGLDDITAAPRENNILYRNRGDGTFADETERSGLAGRGWAGDVAVFDYDEDDWLDVFVTSMFGPAQLYRNQHDGTFADVTQATLGPTPFGGVGAKAFDYDNDGRLDLYVVDMHSDMWMGVDGRHASRPIAEAAEKVRFDHVYGPKVKEQPALLQKEIELQALLDYRPHEVLFGNALYQALGQGKFREASGPANLETFWPWSIATGDFDQDGAEDAFVAAGMGFPYYYWPNSLLMNDGRGKFVDRAFDARVEPPAKGSFLNERIADRQCPRSSRCAATFDFDGDGRLDLIVNNFNDAPYLLHNEFRGGRYVAFRLHGRRGPRDAVGATVRIEDGSSGRMWTRQLHAAGGYLSHSTKLVHFGVGDRERLERVEIRWPSGARQMLAGLAVDQVHDVLEPSEIDASRGDAPNAGVAPNGDER